MKRILSLCMVLTASVALSAQTYSNLVPQPLSVSPEDGAFVMRKGLSVCASDDMTFEREYLKEHLENIFAFEIPVNEVPVYNGIVLMLTEGMESEAYRLNVKEDRVLIEASDCAGIFYGIQTLLQMMPSAVYGGDSPELTGWTLDGVTVEDSPRYAYRGAMLDVSRTFFDWTGWRTTSSTSFTGIWPMTTAGG